MRSEKEARQYYEVEKIFEIISKAIIPELQSYEKKR